MGVNPRFYIDALTHIKQGVLTREKAINTTVTRKFIELLSVRSDDDIGELWHHWRMIPQDATATHPRPDFARVEPSPRFLPHCTEPRIVSLGLAPMQGTWVDVDPTAEWRRHKLRLREQLGDRVFSVRPEARDAAAEFAELVRHETKSDEVVEGDEALWQASLGVADDLVVMLPGDDGRYRLAAASLCSPSDWLLEEKLGLTMEEVHRPIPRLNNEIGEQIDRFFVRLPADRSVQRFNWSIMPHPHYLSREHWEVAAEANELWYRAERQSLRRLPETGAIAFTIRVHICALGSLAALDGALESLWQAVADAPEDLQRYKGLDILAPVIARWRSKNQL